jgi:hypothetical protein
MSKPLVHCSSCTLGVGRSRSVKFAPLRTRRKGGGVASFQAQSFPSLVLLRCLWAFRGFSRKSACVSGRRSCMCYGRAWRSCNLFELFTGVRSMHPCTAGSAVTIDRDRETPVKLFGAPPSIAGCVLAASSQIRILGAGALLESGSVGLLWLKCRSMMG